MRVGCLDLSLEEWRAMRVGRWPLQDGQDITAIPFSFTPGRIIGKSLAKITNLMMPFIESPIKKACGYLPRFFGFHSENRDHNSGKPRIENRV